ncbi:HSDA/SDA1-RELATED protein,putative [Babesia bigemina]|uniref:Protein SDA1 n=1 Tax=Babesia bigemina TaxID=5866 RepID=A0A061D9C3_BABBI|nr:HSDA/SDA1-RELATED protein,putative [Babesia bigemina]CDR95524.1 HSDA/SDA1-RELATED protein,putative [Babesia bigemina]|eukprot:XP_012767710.1 HSDA/SDA1-RELATED protein,putative [Babesia bigemina]
MEGLENLILRIKREPEAHREDFFRKWEEFVAALAVLKLTPHLYNATAMALLNFVAQVGRSGCQIIACQSVSFYCGPQQTNIDIRCVPSNAADSTGLSASGKGSQSVVENAQRVTGASSGVSLGVENGAANAADAPGPELGRDLCMMLIDFVKSHRKRINGKTLKQVISTTFLLRSKRLVDIFTIFPEWLALLDLDDRDVRRRLFVFIVRDLTIVSQQVKDARLTRAVQRLFFDFLKAKSIQVQLLTCCICVEMHKRRVWRDSQTVNNIAQCALASNLKLVLAGAHFLLGTKNHLDVAFSALEDIEEEIAALEDLNKQQQHPGFGAHSKKTEGRQNRLARTKKHVEKQLERRKRRLQLCAVREFAAIDDLHDPQKFTDRLFERCRNKDVTFGAKLILLQLVSILIARHRLMVPNFYGFMLKYINHKQKLVTKILAISAQAVHPDMPTDLLEPLIKQIMDQFVSEDRANEVITVGINTLREIAARAPCLFAKETIGQIVEFRHIKNKAVAMATKSFINLYREQAPEMLHPTLRGREAGTQLTQAKKEKTGTASQKFSSTYILSQEDFKRKKYMGPDEAEAGQSGSGSDHDDDDEEIGASEDEYDSNAEGSDEESEEMDSSEEDVGSESDAWVSDSEEESESEEGDSSEQRDKRGTASGSHPKRKPGRETDDDESEDSDEDEDSEAERIKINPNDLAYGSKRKRVAAESRKEAALARMERKKRRTAAESRAGNKQSTTNRVKARNKPVLMTMQSKRIVGKQTMNIAEKMANLKRHLKSLKKGNMKYKKRRQ